MSRNAQRIQRALAARGYSAIVIEWQPIGPSFEMAGNEGGWTVEFDPPDQLGLSYIGGYNVETVLRYIAELPDVTPHWQASETNGGTAE